MVKPKKSLGQHFLIDKNITEKIALSLIKTDRVIEVGPGKGALTDFFIENKNIDFKAIETDRESYQFLLEKYPSVSEKIILENFLKTDLTKLFTSNFSIIGNFPYNISSQILFKVIDNKNIVDEVVCMIQKEVAERIASKEGNKTYGILSVLLQAYYDIEYLFTVNESVFNPPPKVKSGVIRLTRNKTKKIDCNEVFFKKIIKASFNQRRKMLRVSLKPLLSNIEVENYNIFTKRPEQLTVAEFVYLTNIIEQSRK
jgi:16S rRNA (adenine1518-N6/adenine1519-N6)-dimethyltransferase